MSDQLDQLFEIHQPTLSSSLEAEIRVAIHRQTAPAPPLPSTRVFTIGFFLLLVVVASFIALSLGLSAFKDSPDQS